METSSHLPTNVTNTTDIPQVSTMLQDIIAVLVPLLFAIIFLVGVVGNGTLIFIILRNKKMHSVPNIFILSLACGDLLLIVVAVPSTSIIYTLTTWPFGTTMCKVNEYLRMLSLGVSVFNLTALSGDRYVAIVHPMRAHRHSATKKTLLAAFGIWILSFVLAIPVAVSTFEQFLPEYNISFCKVYPDEWPESYKHVHVIYQLCMYFLLPLVIIAVFYMLMARALVRSSRKMPSQTTPQAQNQLRARKKLAYVVLSFVCIFVICWLPNHIYMVWHHLDPRPFNAFWSVFKPLSFVLSYVNSCVNPVALCFLSKQFKHYFRKHLCCCCRKKHGPVEIEESQNGTMYSFQKANKSRGEPSASTTVLSTQTVC